MPAASHAAGPVVTAASWSRVAARPRAATPGSRIAVSLRDRRRWWRDYSQLLMYALIVLLCLALLMIVSMSRSAAPPPPARPTLIVGSLPFWNLNNGARTLLAHNKVFTEVSPWIYGLDEDGHVVSQVPAHEADAVSRDLRRLRLAGIPVVPSIANMTRGKWAYQPVARVLHDPARRREHIAEIVDLVLRNDYAGIDIDYENLRARDRDEFTAFLTGLSGALHEHGKTLSVAVFAKASDAGYDERNVAQDYAAIGRVVDQVRIMGYDRHWATSEPGPVAPVGWIRDVLDYAESRIPPAKIVLGVPLYGYDWSQGYGRGVTWQEAVRTARTHGVPINYDETAEAPWFTYTDARGHQHEVWFENAASSSAKFAAARDAGIGGVYLWMYGEADGNTWQRLRETLVTGS